MTVEPFLLLNENRFAYTALERLKSRRAVTKGMLVYVYGPSGVGKSHLAKQFLRDFRSNENSRRPTAAGPDGQRIIHITASEFAAQLAEASAAKTIPEFQQNYADLDLFICEDLHALERRMESQRQLMSVFDQTLDHGGGVLVTCRKAPGELESVLPRLVNRCHGGVVAAISQPDRASRISLLSHFGRTRQIPLSAEVVELLADELPVSPRELLAAVAQLETTARLEGSARADGTRSVPATKPDRTRSSPAMIDVDFTRRYLAGEIKPRGLTVPQIVRAVAGHFGLTLAQIRSRSRLQNVVTARHCAMLLARELTGEPLVKIARYFGRGHHSVVAHACNRINRILPEQPSLRQRLTHIRCSLAGGDIK